MLEIFCVALAGLELCMLLPSLKIHLRAGSFVVLASVSQEPEAGGFQVKNSLTEEQISYCCHVLGGFFVL